MGFAGRDDDDAGQASDERTEIVLGHPMIMPGVQ
jgi:hypothetical protein